MSDRAGTETEFGGQTFRSRTEARWAAFLTALDVAFVYEPRRYTLATGETYLPDFWIKPFRAFLEVKPANENIRDAERRRMEMFAAEREDTNLRFWISRGAPTSREDYIEALGKGWGRVQLVGYETGLYLKNCDQHKQGYGLTGNSDAPEYLSGAFAPAYARGLLGETAAIRRAYLAASTLGPGTKAPARSTLEPIFRQPVRGRA
jgi:hypothetical protein